MTTRSTRLAGFVLAFAVMAPSLPAAACGLEGGMGDSFGAAHPGSLEVAFAARDALDAGVLAPDAALESTLGHDRSDDRLRTLAAMLPARKSAAPIAVLLIETGTWTRLTPNAGVLVVTEHAEGPKAQDATLIASELALRDLASGRMSATEALARRVVVVSSDGCCRDQLVAALKLAYPTRSSTVALD